MARLILSLVLMSCLISNVLSQNVVITDDSTYNAHLSSMLDVKSNTKGFLMPRTVRDSINNPAKGLMIYDTTAVKFYFYDGTSWIDLATISGGDSIWLENTTDSLVYLNNAFNKVGIGVDTPFAKLDVMGDTVNNDNDTVPLFVVRDRNGKEVFVVYPKGVFVFVDTIPIGNKSTTNEELTGFRVGRKTTGSTKGFGEEFFTISPANEADTTSSVARVLWYPKKEAFMAGRVIVQHQDSVGLNSWATGFESRALGNFSQALGFRSKAKGDYSTAIGYKAVAEGDYSVALGDSSIAGGSGGNKALNNHCYAFGKASKATGNSSYAFGRFAISSGTSSFAMGDNSQSTKSNSFAFGRKANAAGNGSFAFGDSLKAGTDTTENAFVFGKASQATASNSFAFGKSNKALADGSFCFGKASETRAIESFAFGTMAITEGENSYAIGRVSKATGDYSYAIGDSAHALNDESYAFGKGAIAYGFRSFAFGSAGLDSAGYSTGVTKAVGDYSFAIGQGSVASGFGSFAFGISDTASGQYALAAGYESYASAYSAMALGSDARATGNSSVAIGFRAVASGAAAIALGGYAKAQGTYALATGYNTTASGAMAATAMGYQTLASARSSTAFGELSQATGDYSLATGLETKAYSKASTALGWKTEASDWYALATGAFSKASGFISTAMGSETEASGDYSFATGNFSLASGSYATAMGRSTTAPSSVETTIGQYNTDYNPNSATAWDLNDRLFVIGNGTALNAKSNALTVLKNGNIGIGTATPYFLTDIVSPTSGTTLRLRTNATASGSQSLIQFNITSTHPTNSTYSCFIGSERTATTQDLIFGTASTVGGSPAERVRIKGNGDLRFNAGVFNITNNSERRIIEGGWTSGWGDFTALNSSYDWQDTREPGSVVTSALFPLVVTYGNSGTPYSTTVMSVSNTGIVVMPNVYSAIVGSTNRDLFIDNTGKLGYVSSSKRYKTNIASMEDVSWLYKLRPVNFNGINDLENRKEYGLIAEEVEVVNPLFVSYNDKGTPETVLYSKLITPLLKALQDQKEVIDAQSLLLMEYKAELDNLKNQFDSFRAEKGETSLKD